MTVNKNPLINYENKWVALSKDNKKVLAWNKDFKLLNDQVKKKKLQNKVTLLWVPPFNAALVPNATL